MPQDNPNPSAYVPHLVLLGKDVMGHISVGKACFESGLLGKAIQSYELALARDPAQPIAHLYLARCWFQLRDFEKAEASCIAALQLSPDLVDALLLRGHLLAIREEWSEAEAWYHRTIKADSSQAVAHALLGLSYRQQKALKPAHESYMTAVRLDKTVFFWWLALAELSNELEDHSTAQWAAQQALDLNPLLAQAQYQLGVAHQKQGELEKAEDMFAQASLGNAAYSPGLMQRARILAQTEGSVPTLPLIEILQTKYPRWVRIPLILGEAYLTDRNFESALEVFQQARKQNPGLAEPYYKIGLACLGLNRKADARENFLAACERESPPSPAHVALEQLLLEEPEFAKIR
jgi:tetratricopeptide (TPR) repeat protein